MHLAAWFSVGAISRCQVPRKGIIRTKQCTKGQPWLSNILGTMWYSSGR